MCVALAPSECDTHVYGGECGNMCGSMFGGVKG